MESPSDIKLPSNRKFGLTFAVVFGLIAIYPLLKGQPLRLWAFVPGAIFLLSALVLPDVLRPLNTLWFRFGLLLHMVVSPVVMGVVYFLVLTPISLWLRLQRKDLLSLKFDKKKTSYWISRSPPGPPPESMINQF